MHLPDLPDSTNNENNSQRMQNILHFRPCPTQAPPQSSGGGVAIVLSRLRAGQTRLSHFPKLCPRYEAELGVEHSGCSLGSHTLSYSKEPLDSSPGKAAPAKWDRVEGVDTQFSWPRRPGGLRYRCLGS